MKNKKTLTEQDREARRKLAESSLEEFINLVHPKRFLGNIHREVITWWTASNAKRHQLLLLPRDHMKSALVAYRVAWELTKDPTLTILYISSTSNLAIKQLKFIKDILTDSKYRLYWPEMVNTEEAKREQWTQREISVDDPRRSAESIRDPSIFTAGLTTNIVGMHCDIAVLDDVVVAGNAYTEQGREKVREQYGYLSSVESSRGREWIVGTRYHPLDLYADLIGKNVKHYDKYGSLSREEPMFEIKEHPVETAGDGSGEFLWPYSQRPDGKWFGFNREILEIKKEQYNNPVQFRAQYYNDPNDVDSSVIGRNLFQYYDTNFINKQNYNWHFKNNRLNVVAAVDFAFSEKKTADYTSIVVVGADGLGNYYILDIDRFRTKQISEYYDRIFKLYEKWGFRKLRAEVSVAQAVIVNDLKENYIKKNGLSLTIDEYRPSRWLGAKEERIMAVLEPKYANRQVWHYQGGNTQILEEELIFANPAHDDVKDTLASAIDFVMAPINYFTIKKNNEPAFNFHSRWGGVS